MFTINCSSTQDHRSISATNKNKKEKRRRNSEMGLSDWKDEFEKATPRTSSDYMKEGNFYLRIDVIKEGKNSAKIDNFKVEGTIIHKLDENGAQNVGQSVTHMLSAKNRNYAEDLKSLVADMFGIPVADASFDQLLTLSSDAQPLKGAVVEYYNYDKPTQKENGVFTVCKCRGFKTRLEVEEKLSTAELDRFPLDSLKFIG